jgi:hypothetical protein
MATSSSDAGDTLNRLRQAHADAARLVRETLADIVHAADHAVLVKDTEARKSLKKQETRALKAIAAWQSAADNLRKALRKAKA